MNNVKLTYDDIQKSIKSIVNECYDISENKFSILKSIKKIEIDNYKSFDELRIAMFNHALKYDCELQETFLLKLNELFSNSDFKFESLSDEAQKKCNSSKWNKKTDNYKFTPYFLSDCKINMFIQEKRYEDNSVIYRNVNKVILNTYSYCVISDFTTYFILVYKYEIDPININIAVDSEFEKWLYELFGAKSENIDLIVDWDGEMKELKYKGPIAKIKDENGNDKPIPAKYANKPKKYDLVIGNPPYNNIDLKLLKYFFNVSKYIVFIHPMGFLFDKKDQKKLYIDIKKTNFLKKIKTFWGNEIFKIGSFLPLGITIWDTKKKDCICEFNSIKMNINDVSFHDTKYLKIINDLKNKLQNHISIFDKRTLNDYSNITNYSVKFAAIRGHSHESNGWCDDFFTMIANGNENIVDKNFRYKNKVNYQSYLLWSFNTENERQNFINYCKSKFARFCLSLRKVGSHLDRTEILYVPWLDFTKEWNDAKLCKEFGISEELWNYIDNFIPDYYDDYKSGFEK